MQHVGEERAQFWLKIRIGLVAVLLVGGFLAVVGRVYYLQTVEAEALEERTAVQRDREVTREARRGDIRDRNGAELAVSVEVPSIYVRPRMLGDSEQLAKRLAEILETDEEWVAQRLERDSPFVWLKRQAHPEMARAVEELGVPGLKTTMEYQRYYPMRELAGQALGFVGIDGEGLEGLEREFDDQLAGDTYALSVSRDATGQPMLLSEMPRFGEFEGNSVHLTLDEKIQRAAEGALQKQVEKHDAAGGTALVIEVATGDLLAIAHQPSFDPNRISDHTSSDWRLRAITDTFEPGSVFKPFVVAAALQEQEVELDRVYDLGDGTMRIGAHSIRDVTRREEMTVAQIIQKSSNVGSYKVALEIGRERFYDYIRAFGFGSPTGLGMRGEQLGMVWPPDRWAEISFANISFGQGISATPLQVMMGVSALANGGLLMKPKLVDEVRDRDGNLVWANETTMIRRVISPEVAEQMAWAMSLTTLEAGTGTAGGLEHFTVAAKTGTAQQVDPETGRYSSEHWVSGFVGFAPAEAPEVAIGVFIDEPQGMRYGGAVAGPAFAEIAEEALARQGVLPLPEEERFVLEEEPPTRRASEDSSSERIPAIPPQPPWTLDDRVAVAEGELPDFRMATLRQAVDEARMVGLVPRISGWGRVLEQEPEPGTPLAEVAELRLTLSPESAWMMAPVGPAGTSVDEE